MLHRLRVPAAFENRHRACDVAVRIRERRLYAVTHACLRRQMHDMRHVGIFGYDLIHRRLIGDIGLFDYGEFCAEYSAFDMDRLYHLARAGMRPLVREDANDPRLVSLLDGPGRVRWVDWAVAFTRRGEAPEAALGEAASAAGEREAG